MNDYVLMSISSIEFNGQGNSVDLNITSHKNKLVNGKYTEMNIPVGWGISSKPDWVNVNGSTLSADKNSGSNRNGEVVISQEESGKTLSIPVSQPKGLGYTIKDAPFRVWILGSDDILYSRNEFGQTPSEVTAVGIAIKESDDPNKQFFIGHPDLMWNREWADILVVSKVSLPAKHYVEELIESFDGKDHTDLIARASEGGLYSAGDLCKAQEINGHIGFLPAGGQFELYCYHLEEIDEICDEIGWDTSNDRYCWLSDYFGNKDYWAAPASTSGIIDFADAYSYDNDSNWVKPFFNLV